MINNKITEFFIAVKRNKKFKYGAFATITTAVLLAVIVIVNIVFSLMVDKFNLKLDFTSGNKYSITDVSAKYIKELTTDVSIYVIGTKQSLEQNSNYAGVARMFETYENLNDKVKVEYIDLTVNPGFSSKFPDLAVTSGDVIFSSALRNKKVTLSSLVSKKQDSQNAKVEYFSSAESILTSAIVAVTAQSQFSVSLLTGHGESAEDCKPFITLLESNNFTVSVQNMLTEEINQDAAYVIIAAPTKDFTKEDLQKLDKYLTNNEKYGKNLLYFTYPGVNQLPQLNGFLADWGITVNNGSIYETDSGKHMILSEYFAILEYTDKTYAEDLIAKDLSTMSSPSVPLTINFEEKGYIKTKTLLSFSATSALANSVDGKISKSANDAKGPFPALVQASKTLSNSDGSKKPSSNVVVSAGYIIDKTLLSSASYGNSDYLIRLLNGLIDKDDNLNIAPKVISTQNLNVSQAQSNTISIVFMIIIPLCVVAAGVIVWIKRRSL